MMNRRTFLAATTASTTALAVAKRFPFRPALGVSTASYAIRSRFGRMAKQPVGVQAFGGPLGFLEHCKKLNAVGVQIGVRGWRDKNLSKKLRGRAEELGMYLEGQISLPRNDIDVARFDSEIAATKEAGVTIIRTVMLNGHRYENFNSAADWQAFRESSWKRLTLAEPIARKHGVQLALENHKDWRIEEMIAILKRISSTHVGVNLDTGNNLALLEATMEVVEALAPYTITTHLKDMAVQEYADGFLLSEVPLGQGFLNLPRIIEICRHANPKVMFNLEMITRNPLNMPCLNGKYWTTFGNRPARDLVAALERVRSDKSKTPLPSIAGKTPAKQVAFEEENNRVSFEYARKHLAI